MGERYNKSHGLSRTRIYQIYNNMRYRCYKSYASEFENYGGKGITVCDEWIDKENGFMNFYTWAMNNGYNDKLSIDRIDNTKGYFPNNCRWVNIFVQANNKSNNRLITYNGETRNIAEWVKILSIPRSRLVKRLNSGWSIERAFSK